jgi:hypothetical protein
MTARLLPKWISHELSRINGHKLVVAAVLTVAHDDLRRHGALGLQFANGRLVAGEPAPPARERGRFAVRNLDGWTVRRDDQPKVPRDISFWAPNWHGSGTHLVSREIEAYPIEHRHAKLLTVSATVLEDLRGAAVVRIRVDQPLDRGDPDFSDDIQFNISLLREYCGSAKLYDADMTDAEFARIQRVDWELLPPGSLDQIIARISASHRSNPGRIKVATERLQTLNRLNPDQLISGPGKFSYYFGAKFGETLVALENLEYGNAMYVFETDWETLSQLSRTELIKRRDAGVHRVPHVAGWQSVISRFRRDLARRAN